MLVIPCPLAGPRWTARSTVQVRKLPCGGVIMTSAAQVQANRLNAQKSTGPRTPEGKAAVARNAVKHGLLAQAAVLREEDRDRYTRYHEKMVDEVQPEGLQETELVERIVHCS